MGSSDAADRSQLQERVGARVDELRDELLEVSHAIWDRPELCFEEHFAHDTLTASLERHGLSVERGACGLDTAFVATTGPAESGPVLAVLCEYDALPEVGHACGHNVIAAAGLGAGLAAATLVADLGGEIRVLGTPAEEGGGGKQFMIDAGAFDDVDVAMMVHPADHELDAFWAIAIHRLRVEYHGRPAHAAAAPEQGVNALDAAVLGYQAVAALRQHIASHERVHGVFTAAGDKPNVVPHHTAMEWYVRSGTRESLELLKPRVLAALESGATATGATMSHQWQDPPYDDLRLNPVLDELWASNAEVLGREVRSRESEPQFMGSTDMGNVSHVVPSIHPMVAVAPPGITIHTPEFADFARGDAGDAAVVDGAKMMAATMARLLAEPALVEHARQHHAEWVRQAG